LRWRGQFAGSYALFVPMAFVHLSQAGILLFGLLIMDLLVRPKVLRRPVTLVPVILSVGIFLWREQLWYVIGAREWLVVALLVLVVAVVCVVLYYRKAVSDLPRRIARGLEDGFIGQRLGEVGRMPVVAGDTIMLILGWFSVFCLTWVGNQFASPLQSTYFWNQMAGRIIGIIAPILIVAALYMMLVKLSRSISAGVLRKGGLAAVVVLALPLLFLKPPHKLHEDVILRVTTNMAKLDERMQEQIDVFDGDDEATYYYALAKTMATDQDFLKVLWK